MSKYYLETDGITLCIKYSKIDDEIIFQEDDEKTVLFVLKKMSDLTTILWNIQEEIDKSF